MWGGWTLTIMQARFWFDSGSIVSIEDRNEHGFVGDQLPGRLFYACFGHALRPGTHSMKRVIPNH